MIQILARWLVLLAGPIAGALPHDAARVARVEAIVASTTQIWSTYLPGYQAPRVTFLRPPVGHPARGAGYHAAAGVIVDLGDVESLEAHFRDEAPTLVGFIVAHEVGHQVQGQTGDAARLTAAQRERQADCYAGWWMAKANENARAAGSAPYAVDRLELRLPQMLRLLSVLRTGESSSRRDAIVHGSEAARAAAFRRGFAGDVPTVCREL